MLSQIPNNISVKFLIIHHRLNEQCLQAIICVSIKYKESYFIKRIKNIFHLNFLPNCICSQQIVLFILLPIHTSNTKVIVFRHFQRSFCFFPFVSKALSSKLRPLIVDSLRNVLFLLYVHFHF